jgi:hypothetical protein
MDRASPTGKKGIFVYKNTKAIGMELLGHRVSFIVVWLHRTERIPPEVFTAVPTEERIPNEDDRNTNVCPVCPKLR